METQKHKITPYRLQKKPLKARDLLHQLMIALLFVLLSCLLFCVSIMLQ